MLSRVVKTAQNGRSHYHRSFLLPPMLIFIQSFIHSFIQSFLGLYYFFPGVHILAILGLVPCTVMYTSGFYTTASFKMLNIKGLGYFMHWLHTYIHTYKHKQTHTHVHYDGSSALPWVPVIWSIGKYVIIIIENHTAKDQHSYPILSKVYIATKIKDDEMR